ncbi:hypothetical protein I4U23_029745 [Adineta vaga]|nr:hypothetical protein I4U23_029745 [Adineta vaga]
MASEVLSTANPKKRRIMIITGDESIIEQIQNSNNSSLIQSIIIESKDIDESNTELAYSLVKNDNQLSNQKKTKQGSLTCVVCGSPALGYNFDAITCESCKAFFRRNGLKTPTSFQCRRKGACEVTIETRRRCSSCRLAKCLSHGMKRDRLLTAEEKSVKRRKMEENRSSASETQHSVEEKSSSAFLDFMFPSEETNLLRLTDFTDLLPESSPTLMTIEDLQRIETIQDSYEKRIELAARDGLPWNPSEHATTFLQNLNSRSVTAMRLLTFFRQIPEFNELNVDDKVTLIKYNLMPLILLNSSLAYKIDTNQIKETDSDVPIDPDLFRKIHGTDIFLQIKRIFNSFVRIAQCDQRIIQLILIVLILTKGFSTDPDGEEPILNDGFAVYRAQNYYTELLWKYMETTHGAEQSIRIFSELIAHFRSWQKVEAQIRVNTRKLLPTDTNEILPIMRSLLHI